MVGLALVSFVTVFAAGIKGSIDDAIDKTLIGDLTISNDDGFSDIPIGVRDEVASVDGVEVASALRFTEDEVDGEQGTLTLIDPATAAQVLSLDWDEGSDELLTNLADDEAVIDETFAKDENLEVGSTFTAETVSGDPVTLTVVGTFTDNSDFIGDYAASDANAEAFGEERSATNVFINLDPGADAGRGPLGDRGGARPAASRRSRSRTRRSSRTRSPSSSTSCSGSSTCCCCSRWSSRCSGSSTPWR